MTHEQLDLAMSALRKIEKANLSDEEREAVAVVRRQIIIERFKLDHGVRHEHP
ncbi:MAG TPA: hypothetical protein VGD41_12100 [Pyrinomonadaceae bacterium]